MTGEDDGGRGGGPKVRRAVRRDKRDKATAGTGRSHRRHQSGGAAGEATGHRDGGTTPGPRKDGGTGGKGRGHAGDRGDRRGRARSGDVGGEPGRGHGTESAEDGEARGGPSAEGLPNDGGVDTDAATDGQGAARGENGGHDTRQTRDLRRGKRAGATETNERHGDYLQSRQQSRQPKKRRRNPPPARRAIESAATKGAQGEAVLRRKSLRSNPPGRTAFAGRVFGRPLRGRLAVLGCLPGGGLERGRLVSDFLGGERERGVWRRPNWFFFQVPNPPLARRAVRAAFAGATARSDGTAAGGTRRSLEIGGGGGFGGIGLRETHSRAPAAFVAQALGGGFA